MTTKKVPVNRGPAAAAENRQAILRAARRLFAKRGYDVPIAAIAREAGVSQAVMYRHFPRRVELALEVFEDNFIAIEEILDTAGDRAIFVLWDWLLGRAVDDAGFIETIRAARLEVPHYRGHARLLSLLEIGLERARGGGYEVGTLQPDDLMHAWRMAYGLVVTAKEDEVSSDWLKVTLSLAAVRRLYNR